MVRRDRLDGERMSADGELTRRDALRRFGFGVATAGALLAQWTEADRASALLTRSFGATTVRGTPSGSGTQVPPSLPPNATKGQGAWRMICWGGYGHTYRPAADYETWKEWGFGGHATGVGGSKYLFGFGGANDFIAGSAAGTPGSQYDWQKALEG